MLHAACRVVRLTISSICHLLLPACSACCDEPATLCNLHHAPHTGACGPDQWHSTTITRWSKWHSTANSWCQLMVRRACACSWSPYKQCWLVHGHMCMLMVNMQAGSRRGLGRGKDLLGGVLSKVQQGMSKALEGTTKGLATVSVWSPFEVGWGALGGELVMAGFYSSGQLCCHCFWLGHCVGCIVARLAASCAAVHIAQHGSHSACCAWCAVQAQCGSLTGRCIGTRRRAVLLPVIAIIAPAPATTPHRWCRCFGAPSCAQHQTVMAGGRLPCTCTWPQVVSRVEGGVKEVGRMLMENGPDPYILYNMQVGGSACVLQCCSTSYGA